MQYLAIEILVTIHFRPKKISVIRVTGLKILGRVGTHIFSLFFFLEKNTILCILKGIAQVSIILCILCSCIPLN